MRWMTVIFRFPAKTRVSWEISECRHMQAKFCGSWRSWTHNRFLDGTFVIRTFDFIPLYYLVPDYQISGGFEVNSILIGKSATRVSVSNSSQQRHGYLDRLGWLYTEVVKVLWTMFSVWILDKIWHDLTRLRTFCIIHKLMTWWGSRGNWQQNDLEWCYESIASYDNPLFPVKQIHACGATSTQKLSHEARASLWILPHT